MVPQTRYLRWWKSKPLTAASAPRSTKTSANVSRSGWNGVLWGSAASFCTCMALLEALWLRVLHRCRFSLRRSYRLYENHLLIISTWIDITVIAPFIGAAMASSAASAILLSFSGLWAQLASWDLMPRAVKSCWQYLQGTLSIDTDDCTYLCFMGGMGWVEGRRKQKRQDRKSVV